MTIQKKAIEQLERISNHLSAIGEKEDYTDIAIQALEKGTCEDCISREQAKEEIRKAFPQLKDRVEINSILNGLPSVKQEPKVGHWKAEKMGKFGVFYRCSECHELYNTKTTYCPFCGAKLESEGKE